MLKTVDRKGTKKGGTHVAKSNSRQFAKTTYQSIAAESRHGDERANKHKGRDSNITLDGVYIMLKLTKARFVRHEGKWKGIMG